VLAQYGIARQQRPAIANILHNKKDWQLARAASLNLAIAK
jgi:hypothetical protein